MITSKEVLDYSKLIEQKLRDFGGKGSGMVSLAASLDNRIDTQLFNKITNVSKVRNGYAHELGYFYSGDSTVLRQDFEDVLSKLNNIDSKESGKHMIMTEHESYWVRRVDSPNWKRYPPDINISYVIQRKSEGDLEVIEQGKKYYAFWGLAQAFFVNMKAKNISFVFDEDIHSEDRIPLEVNMNVTLQIRNEKQAIKDITFNEDICLSAVESEVKEACHRYLSGWEHILNETLFTDSKKEEIFDICGNLILKNTPFKLLKINTFKVLSKNKKHRDQLSKILDDDMTKRAELLERERKLSSAHFDQVLRLVELDTENREALERAKSKTETFFEEMKIVQAEQDTRGSSDAVFQFQYPDNFVEIVKAGNKEEVNVLLEKHNQHMKELLEAAIAQNQNINIKQ